MTSAQPIAVLLQPYLQQGLSLWLEGDMLRFKAGKELMTPALMNLLKQNKPAIIDWLRAESSATDNAPTLVDEFPLASTQGAIWMLYRFAPNSPAYNTTFACTLKGELNETAVRQAFHALMIRHPILRTTFKDTDHGPRQQVWDHMPMPLELVDGSGWNAEELEHWLNQEADAPFDLTRQCCLRVKIVRNSVRGNILIATIQHVGADLWALLIVAKDIKEFYQRAARGEVLSLDTTSVTYRQHVEWQQQFLDSDRGKTMRRYWQRALQGAPTQVSFPTDFPRPPLLQLKTALNRQLVGGDTYRAIKTFCKQNSITPFAFIQTALQLLMHQATAAQDFLLGTPTMGRSQKGMDQVVGDFANPVVLRARVQPDQHIHQLLQQVKRTSLDAMEYQDYPFPVVVQDSNPPRDSSRTPLFQVMFVWHQGNAELLAQDDWIGEVLPLSGPRGAPYDVMLAVSDLGDHFEMNWTYQISLYQPQTIERFGIAIQSIMSRVMETTDRTVAQCLAVSDTGLIVQPQLQLMDLPAHPALAEFECHGLSQTLADGRTVQRMFVECAQATLPSGLQQVVQQGLPGWDDITVLPNLPRTGEGAVDEARLSNLPMLDRARVEEDLQQRNLPADAVAVLHDRVLIPTAEPAEIAAFQKQSRQGSAPRKVDITTRPDAWVVGAPLSLPADGPAHLFTALCQTAERFPDRGLTLVDDQRNVIHYSYAQLVSDARRVAAGLQQAGLESGSILLLQMQYDQRFFPVWWGALLAGLRPLNVATPDHYTERNGVAQKLYNVAHNYPNLTVAADAARLADTQAWLGANKPVISADALLQTRESWQGELSNDPVAFLQLTSGSTGTPKAIQITHHGILHHIAASARHNDYSADDINLNWLPFDHVVPILTTHIKDCVLGIQQIQLTTRSVLNDPLWWLDAMSEFGVTHSWAPNFAFQRVVEALSRLQDKPTFNLHKVRFLMNAGEQVLAPVVQRFNAACAPMGLRADAVQPAFGMAEACTCITYNNNSSELLSVHFNPALDPSVCDINAPHLSSHGFVDLGSLMPGVEIRITNEQNELVKEGVIGRMQIRGPVVTPGYLNNTEANAEAFVGEGWFNSGDLGFIWNQRLILTGREKEMIVVNGANYYCFEIEQAATIPGVVPTFVAATGVALEAGTNSDALVLFYVSDHSVEAAVLERQMAARVAEAFGIPPAYLIAVEADNFHKTTSGKIQRGQFRKNFEKQQYEDQVEAYLQRHRKNDDLTTTLFEMHWDTAHSAPLTLVTASLWCDETLEHNSTIVRWRQYGATVNTASALHDMLAQSQTGIHTILLQDLTRADVALEHLLFELVQKLALLKPAIQTLDAATAGRLQIAVIGQQVSDTLLLKPILETLRQETGHPHLTGLVLSTALQTAPEPIRTVPFNRSVLWVDEPQRLTRPLLRAVNRYQQQPHAIVRNGIYAITGGLAGLSDPLCHYLIAQKRCRVILLGRSVLEQQPQRQYRFQQMQQLLGAANVVYQPLSGWSTDQLHEAIQAGLKDLNAQQLDGVFHLAGHLDMTPLEAVDNQYWQQQVEPKWQGAIGVASYLQQHFPQAVLVHYSSLNALLGGQNAAAYSAANSLQSWQTARQNAGGLRCWTLHWSVWANTGMASAFSHTELQLARNKGLLPLDKSRDLFWLDAALTQPPGNYYIGLDPNAAALRNELDFNNQSRDHYQMHAWIPAGTSTPEIQRWLLDPAASIDAVRVEQHLWQQPLPSQDNGGVDIERLRQMGAAQAEQETPPANATEQDLVTIWSGVLNRAIPDVTRSFFEYGGHSINATQLIARINQHFSQTFTVAHLFQYPSIREFAGLMTGDVVQTATTLALGLQDFIARAGEYRIDCVNPGVESKLDIVFLPTASGLASAYLLLMSQLNKARLHVISMPLIAQTSESLSSVANEFIRLIDQSGLKAEQTLLVGWSMGGVLGYEMLTRLQQQHRLRPQLVMLDSGFGVGLHPVTFDPDFQLLMFAVELGLGAEHFAEFNQLADATEKLQWLKQYLLTIGIEVTQTKLLEWSEAYKRRLQRLEHHSIADERLESHITLIKAEWHSHGRSDLGWGDANNNINWQSVAADHQGIVKHPDVANWLRQRCT